MKKKLIVAAVAAAVAAPTIVAADATVYGKARVATQYSDREDGQDNWGLVDQISRLGIKGSEDLGNGLKAIYKMEFGVNVGDGYDTAGFWSARNAYVGLAGDWGTFLAGRHDTPYKMSSGKLDFFADTAADYDNGCDVASATCAYNVRGAGQLFNSLRVDGAIAYVSPSMSGFTFMGAIVQTNGTASFDDADDFASAYSLALQYSNGPWFASLAYEDLDPESLAGVAGDDDTKWRVGLGILGMSGFSASIIYEDREAVGFVDGADRQSWQIQGAYDFGNNRIKAMYGDRDDDSAADSDFDVWAIGYQYNFSSRTDVQVLYRDLNADGTNVNDDAVFAVQLDHSF